MKLRRRDLTWALQQIVPVTLIEAGIPLPQLVDMACRKAFVCALETYVPQACAFVREAAMRLDDHGAFHFDEEAH